MKEILDVIVDDRISGHGKKKTLKQFKERFTENKCKWKHFPKCLLADYTFEQGTDAYDEFLHWDSQYGERIGLVKFSQVKYEIEDNHRAKGFLLLSKEYGEESVDRSEIRLKKVPKNAECFIGTDTGRLYITAEIYQRMNMPHISDIKFIPALSSKPAKEIQYYYLHSEGKNSTIETIRADSPDQRTFYSAPDAYYSRPYKLLTDGEKFSVLSVLIDGYEKNTVVSKEIYDFLKATIKDLTGIPLQ